MKPIRAVTSNPLQPFSFSKFTPKLSSSTRLVKWVSSSISRRKFSMAAATHGAPLTANSSSPPPQIPAASAHNLPPKLLYLEENIEKVVYGSRFLAILGVWGSLVGSLLCFIKGCVYVVASYQEYVVNRGKVILLLIEAIDIYLLGTVMLVFGMGLYELFISTLDIAKSSSEAEISYRSNLFGLFPLKERPKWLEIKSVNALKTKLGHVIVMLLLIGLIEKSKKAAIYSSTDLLCFSASVFLSSGCLYMLSKLNGHK